MKTQTRLEPTAPNLRAELARHGIQLRQLEQHINMYKGLLSNYLRGHKPLTTEAAVRIARGANELMNAEIFNTDIKDP